MPAKPEQDTVYSVEEIKARLEPVFRKNGVRKAVLFGSYGRGQANSKSDIDILVDSQLRGLAFFGLLEDVVEALQKDVDLIDTRQISIQSEIYREISQTGIEIYAA
ncbi:MAG: nucleotidyltransferase domain-containing protein [Clostridia bacterium]|nr:nucleotidyltransferase domain-containing protein [Clostridia bacterium]NCC75647.1 nucleotidyltransferase domain-containing protein [Clostridia bacterium]